MFFSLNKDTTSDYLKLLNEQSNLMFEKLFFELKNNNVKILVELYFFYYFLTDLCLSEKNFSKNERESFLNNFFESIHKLLSRESDISETDLNSIFNMRIQFYFLILEKNNNEISFEFYKDCYEYLIELIASIILKNSFSNFNPCPKSPLDFSSKITNLLITSEIRSVLTGNHELTVKYIANLFNKGAENKEATFEIINKYTKSISQIFYEEFLTENEFVNTEIFIYLYILFCFSKNIEAYDLPIMDIIKYVTRTYSKKINKDLLLNRYEIFFEYFEKSKKNISRSFFEKTFYKLSGIISSCYESKDLIKLSEKQNEKKYEIRCRTYTSLYKSFDILMNYLSEISTKDFKSEKGNLFNEICKLSGLKKYKKLIDNQIFDLEEIFSLYNFRITEGYTIIDVPFYIMDSIYESYCHSLIATKDVNNSLKRFDYSKSIDRRKAYINYTVCEQSKNIFDYLLFQLILEVYENINNPNSWMILVTEEDEIKEYLNLIEKNPILNDSFKMENYPNIEFYNDFFYVGLFTKEQQGVYFKIFKVKSGFTYDVVYKDLIKKNETVIMF